MAGGVTRSIERPVGLAASSCTAAALLAVVVGAPVTMVWVADRGPARAVVDAVRHPALLGQAFSRPVDPTEVVGGMLLLGGAAWLWVVACVVVEVWARLRGTAARRLPGSARLQQVVGVLVGAALSVVPAARVVAAPVAPPAAVAQAMPPLSPAATPSIPTPTTVTTPAPEAFEVYTVVPGDTLWSIAERQHGAPLRWRQIAALNQDRPQPDGQRLVDDNWIMPGWQLVLPIPVAAATAAAATPAAVASAATVVAPDPTGRPLVPDAGMARRAPSPAAGPEPRADHRGPGAGDLTGIVEFGVLAAVVIALVDRLRRVQQRHRPAGLRITLPPDDVAALEGRLRRHARDRPRTAAGEVLALLATGAAETGVCVPAVAAVRVGPGSAEIVLDPGGAGGTMGPWAPFQLGAMPWEWRLGPAAVAGRPPGQPPGAAPTPELPPTLVTVGRTGADHLSLDLAVLGALSVDHPRAMEICQAMVVELAASPSAGDLEIVLVGFPAAFDAFERVRRVPDLDRACSIARRRVAERLAARRWATEPLGDGHPDDCTVVMCGPQARCAPAGSGDGDVPPPLEHPSPDRLVALGRSGTGGLAVVLGWSVASAPWRLCTATDDGAELRWHDPEPSGDDGAPIAVGRTGDEVPVPTARRPVAERPVAETLEVQQLGTRAVHAVASLVRSATDLSGVDASAAPYRALPKASGGPEGNVEVRILGPVEVVGAERPFTRAWTLELVVYLALHPSGATTDQWATALWPDRLMAPASLHSTASAARRSLGADASGTDHLPRSHGRLQLATTVTTDWSRFEVGAASEEPERWREALALVRGRPFDGLRANDWALLEGVLPAIESSVVDVADRLGQFCLGHGDPAGAQWAARRGLVVSSYDERLYRVLLRAADLAGNPAGVESVMAELVRLVAEDVEPFDAVHPETLELYRALSRRGEGATRS